MKLWDIISTANSNLMRNKGRAFLTILAIFIGSFTIIVTSGIRTGVNSYIDEQLNAAGGEGTLSIMPEAMRSMMQSQMGMATGDEPQEFTPDTAGREMTVITENNLEQIRAIDGIESVRGEQQIQAEYIGSDHTDRRFVFSPQALPSDRLNVLINTGRPIDINSPTPEINLMPGFAKALGFESDEAAVGQTVRIGVVELATLQTQEVTATVAGVMNQSIINLGRSWVNNALQEKILDVMYTGMPDSLRNTMYFATGEWDTSLGSEGLDRIKNDLSDIGFIGQTPEDQAGMFKSFFDAIILVFTIFGGVALLAASIGIINTLFMAVQERTREIGLMKAMGLSRGKIFLMFSIEAVALGFWGSALGITVAYLAKIIINPIASRTFLSDLPGFDLLKYDVPTLVALALLIMVIAFLAGTMPARRAAKKDPIEALRYE
jgi:putative ABC transport system permease protein